MDQESKVRFIALLRGINISGKNKISMPELKTALAEKGFADVKSGFLLFFPAYADITPAITTMIGH